MILYEPEGYLSVVIPEGAHNLSGFREWVNSDEFPERGHISLIEGEVLVDMSPERVQAHNKAKSEIMRVLGNIVHEADSGELYSDRVWFTNDEASLSTEPDGAFANWETLTSGALKIVPLGRNSTDGIEMRGRPDWTLEIVSDHSIVKDTKRLPEAYYRAGVREYWLVDSRGEKLMFTVFHRGEKAFVPTKERSGGRKSIVFECEFRLERKVDRLGGWKYSLKAR